MDPPPSHNLRDATDAIHAAWSAAAPPTAAPRAHWATYATWDLIRAIHRTHYTLAGRSIKRALLTMAFTHWRHTTRSSYSSPADHRSTITFASINRTLLAAWMRNLSKPLAAAIRRDKRTHVLALATKATHAADAGDARTPYKTLRLVSSGFPPPAPALETAAGDSISTDHQRARAFAAHFANLQNGKRATLDDINAIAPRAHDLQPNTRSAIFPSTYGLASDIKRLAPHKSPGHEGLPTGLP